MLKPREIESLVLDQRIRVLQTSEPAPDAAWQLLNETFFSRRPDVQLRIYGHYSSPCDLSFLKRMSNVRSLAVDSLQSARSLEAVSALRGLQTLSVGIYDLETFDFLGELDASILTDLTLGPTRSKRPNLRAIRRFTRLKRLYLDGQQNGISVLSSLTRVADLTLRSVSLPSLTMLCDLPELWSIDIKLGGCSDLSALAGMTNIKYLELWQVRGLCDLRFMSGMSGLQYVFLQSLRRVAHLPDVSKLTKLRRIHVENMRGLQTLEPLVNAPALEELICVDSSNFDPDDFVPLLRSGRLKALAVGLGSDRKNSAVSELMSQYSVGRVGSFEPFAFA